jgi:hypothetical protein
LDQDVAQAARDENRVKRALGALVQSDEAEATMNVVNSLSEANKPQLAKPANPNPSSSYCPDWKGK